MTIFPERIIDTDIGNFLIVNFGKRYKMNERVFYIRFTRLNLFKLLNVLNDKGRKLESFSRINQYIWDYYLCEDTSRRKPV